MTAERFYKPGVVGWGIWLDVGAHVVWDAVLWDGTQVGYLRTDRAASPVCDCLDQISGGVTAMSEYDRLDLVLSGPGKKTLEMGKILWRYRRQRSEECMLGIGVNRALRFLGSILFELERIRYPSDGRAFRCWQ